MPALPGPLTPNATLQAPLIAEARYERRLSAVACKRLFDMLPPQLLDELNRSPCHDAYVIVCPKLDRWVQPLLQSDDIDLVTCEIVACNEVTVGIIKEKALLPMQIISFSPCKVQIAFRLIPGCIEIRPQLVVSLEERYRRGF